MCVYVCMHVCSVHVHVEAKGHLGVSPGEPAVCLEIASLGPGSGEPQGVSQL